MDTNKAWQEIDSLARNTPAVHPWSCFTYLPPIFNYKDGFRFEDMFDVLLFWFPVVYLDKDMCYCEVTNDCMCGG